MIDRLMMLLCLLAIYFFWALVYRLGYKYHKYQHELRDYYWDQRPQ